MAVPISWFAAVKESKVNTNIDLSIARDDHSVAQVAVENANLNKLTMHPMRRIKYERAKLTDP